ncbi:hypothetical protein AX17_004411 [Amanita inopinata Kibby_2008]|nr:hypothetical protein AX17_004411 [Amanita inopinata Kibby_2008]
MDLNTPIATNHHSYGTRIRHNVSIKPSQRLRQSPDSPCVKRPKHVFPKHHNPAVHNFPQFPPHIVLHPDDASNKVFLAIARALLSVDNRAMTIKDLAELSASYGLVCQNVSAASQAITSYIRTHMQRCEAQQDHPLLLRHVLSGTNADDDLLPALHSRSGGAHCAAAPESRITNFRRGTMVWYLSRATGAPCPFARAGIRLCDYGESGKSSAVKAKDRQHGAEQQTCGQKRKRALRSNCSEVTSDSDSLDEGRPPPKVKLTLRLPSIPASVLPKCASVSKSPDSRDVIGITQESSDESDQTDVDSMSEISELSDGQKDQSCHRDLLPPPHPRLWFPYSCLSASSTDGPLNLPTIPNEICRSPSTPLSVGSPPPDSEDDVDDYHISMTDWDDFDSDADFDTVWESPGPRSPSAPMVFDAAEINVKDEPHDVQGMLDAWDNFDNSIADVKVVEVLAKAAASVLETRDVFKSNETDIWGFENYMSPDEWYYSPLEQRHIKHEDLDIGKLFDSAAVESSSPRISPQYPDCISSTIPHTRCDQQCQLNTVTAPTPSDPKSTMKYSSLATPIYSLASLIQTLSMNSPSPVISPSSLVLPPSSCVSPHETRCNAPASPVVVVHTCKPTSPPICATQVEDISVYQMILGSMIFLRRIDTDFVNLTPIVHYAGAPFPVLSTISNATVITKGSPVVSGTWVPLSTAQTYIRDHPVPGGALDMFLSDKLYEQFPQALQEFHLSNTPGRMLNQFGRHFGSTLQATQLAIQSDTVGSPHVHRTLASGLPGKHVREDVVQSLPTRTQVVEASTTTQKLSLSGVEVADSPLSATEQEMFHALCIVPEWDRECPAMESVSETGCEDEQGDEEQHVSRSGGDGGNDKNDMSLCVGPPKGTRDGPERPLRRSKRVADAIAARTRSQTRRRRGG